MATMIHATGEAGQAEREPIAGQSHVIALDK